MEKFAIAGNEIKPGEEVTLEIPLPDIFGYLPVKMPILVRRAAKPGPRLFITSVLHGDEIIGIEVIQRLQNSGILKNLISGDVVIIPVVNAYGFVQQQRYLPDRKDLNRCFPGNPTGPLASRLAFFLFQEVISKCTHGIDMHSGSTNHFNLPQTRVDSGDPVCIEMAKAFAAPVTLMKSGQIEGSLRNSCKQLGISVLLFEGSEANRFEAEAADIGWKGIVHVMEYLGMLEKTERIAASPSFISASSFWERSPCGGIFRTTLDNRDYIKKGDVIGDITNLLGKPVSQVIATTEGMIMGITKIHTVNAGDALFHVAGPESAPETPAETEV